MAPTHKNTNKTKGKAIPARKSAQSHSAPSLEDLERAVEKNAMNNDEQQSASARISVELSSPIRKSTVLSNPEALPADLVQQMRADIDFLRRQREEHSSLQTL